MNLRILNFKISDVFGPPRGGEQIPKLGILARDPLCMAP